MFQQLIAAIIIIGNFHAARQALKLNFKAIGQGTAALLASCLAFYFLFFVVNNKSGYYNFVHDEYLLKFCSINGLDLLRGGLLGKLIFHSPTPLKWMLDWHALSMGVVGFILILAGIYSPQLNYKKELLLILIITFFIGLGPYVQIFTFKIELPYGYVWNHSDILKFIRFPYRIFMITLVPIAIFMAHGFNRLWQVKLPTLPKQSWLLLIAIYAVENLPLFSLRGSETGAFITQSDKYLHFTKQLTGETILYLPTYNIVKPSYKDNSYMAIVPEYIYMYLQTKQPNNILNGCSGFYPPDRMKLNTSIDEFNNTGITTQLVDSFNFTYLVYYKKDPFNYINYDYRIKDLIANKKLQVVYNDSIQIVFKKQARLPA